MTEANPRFTLRQLPLPAKLVVTAFLMAVGLGYTAAMVQLHMQDAKSGKPMPTMEDVILKYTGKKKFANQSEMPRPACRIEKVLSGDRTGDLVGTNMAPAFFAKDGGKYDSLGKAGPEAKAKVDAEREGELASVMLWAQADVNVREQAYKADRFMPADIAKAPQTVTAKFKHDDGSIKVKSILSERCARCHYDGAQRPRLDDFAEIARSLAVPAGSVVPEGGGFVRVEEPISLEKLTQSTHAHLLSFAVLFSLTGLVFSFTNYPAVVRCLLGPLVCVALVADISLWWLARLNEPYGPYFAMCIIGTGGAAGLGLAAQITLSLFNMYGPKGKGVILLLFLLGGAVGGWITLTVVYPGLQAKAEPKPKPEPTPTAPKDKKDSNPVAPTSPRFETVLTGEYKKGGPWGKGKGGMVRAFFDKDELTYEESMKPQREGELAALLAWAKAEADARKKAYEADRFELPAELANKPMTPTMQVGSNVVKVKTLINERCVTCHGTGKDREDLPMENYEQIAKFFTAGDANKKVDAAPTSVPPIPMAKADPKVEPTPVAPAGPSLLETVVTGPFDTKRGFNAKPGGMVRAFFDKDDEFKDALKAKSPDLPKLTAARENEQAAVLAWIKSPPDVRKAAFETDKFPLPAPLAGKPFTAAFKSDDKSVKVKTLFAARCVTCHGEGGEKADAPLEKYEEILEFLKPGKE